MKKCVVLLFVLVAFVSGCRKAGSEIFDVDGKSSAMQTRHYETGNKRHALHAVIATLQDLGFVLDTASYDLGVISATKLEGYKIRMTVVVNPREEEQMIVRADAWYNIEPIRDPVLYQSFFDALSKQMQLKPLSE